MMHQPNGLESKVLTRLSRIALIGNAIPRRCGLATYTTHSALAVRAVCPDLRVDHYAMDDGMVAGYGDDVAATIPAGDVTAYVHAAAQIQRSGADVIWVQHEFGIFGGPAGDYLLALLGHCNLPVLVTLHTVLAEPNDDQRRVMRGLAARVDHFVVMADHAAKMLADVYQIARDRISVIPHGAPDRALIPSVEMKRRLGLPLDPTILTFGLLSPGKGLENAISALPDLVRQHPDLIYRIIGATHPMLVSREGERYRESLVALADQLGVADRVDFVNAYLGDDDIIDQLQACDIYLTPYLGGDQVTSGTLAYALAMGRPVVSTPYIHAREALADGVAGKLVPFRDPAAIAAALHDLLADPVRLEARSEAIWQAARPTIWAHNARRVVRILSRLAAEQPAPIRTAASRLDSRVADMAPLAAMTDDVGIYQHGRFGIADRNHGYCIDDNARALMLTSVVRTGDPVLRRRLARTYAAFVEHAWSSDVGRFRNFMGFDRRWLEDVGSEDSNGRTLWALAQAAVESDVADIRRWAACLFARSLPMASTFTAPRATAFALLGMTTLARHAPGMFDLRENLDAGKRLFRNMLDSARRPGWEWMEPALSYDNARLSQAMIEVAIVTEDDALLTDGLSTLRWLIGMQSAPAGHFRPVGTEGFGMAYQAPAQFDQQPIEAVATVEACLSALRATRDSVWLKPAETALAWFHGENDLGIPLVDSRESGCHDGLTRAGVNLNRGAESILAYEAALAALAAARSIKPVAGLPDIEAAPRAVA